MNKKQEDITFDYCSEERLTAFIQIYSDLYQITLTRDQAREYSRLLLELLKSTCKPDIIIE